MEIKTKQPKLPTRKQIETRVREHGLGVIRKLLDINPELMKEIAYRPSEQRSYFNGVPKENLTPEILQRIYEKECPGDDVSRFKK